MASGAFASAGLVSQGRGRLILAIDISERLPATSYVPVMPITPFLAHQTFDPEIIKTMSAAYVATCRALHLKVGDDPATRLVA
jgi:hypothetical protein